MENFCNKPRQFHLWKEALNFLEEKWEIPGAHDKIEGCLDMLRTTSIPSCTCKESCSMWQNAAYLRCFPVQGGSMTCKRIAVASVTGERTFGAQTTTDCYVKRYKLWLSFFSFKWKKSLCAAKHGDMYIIVYSNVWTPSTMSTYSILCEVFDQEP